MQEIEKKNLLKKIALLIETNDAQTTINLKVMEYLSIEELNNIYNSLLKRKENRKNEQKSWYNEWANKCAKDLK